MEENGDNRPPSLRVTIVEGPHEGLQELFNPNSQRATTPMNKRNFPKSFWIPPTDEKSRSSNVFNENDPESGIISHRKSYSSPSTIGTNQSYLTEPIDHNRQKSLDTTYNYIQLAKEAQLSNNSDSNSQFFSRRGFRNPEVQDSLTSPICELPLGYEMAIHNNKVYFLNHQTEQTTWFDPRLPQEEQKWGMTLKELDQLHINYALRQRLGANSLETSAGSRVGGKCVPTNQIASRSNRDGSSPVLTGSPNVPQMAGCVAPTSASCMKHPGVVGGPPSFSLQRTTNRQQPMNLLPPQSKSMSRSHGGHIIHTKSSSQPVPMPTVEGISGHSGDSLMCPIGYALAPSSSLSGLMDHGAAHFPTEGLLTNSSSGHLVQDLEDLSLTTSCTTGGQNHSPLPKTGDSDSHLPLASALHLHLPTSSSSSSSQQQQQLFAQNILMPHLLSDYPAGGQHSHQSSMDSGVGQSLAGHSIPSANQTPEHAKTVCFDSSMDNCDISSDYISYSSNWGQPLDCYMSDRMPASLEMTRSQQG